MVASLGRLLDAWDSELGAVPADLAARAVAAFDDLDAIAGPPVPVPSDRGRQGME